MASKKTPVVTKDPEKERKIKELVTQLQAKGYTVRREKLKQGPGWKVISGTCRVNAQKMVFLDPRLTQEEQILFLQGINGSLVTQPTENSENNSAQAA